MGYATGDFDADHGHDILRTVQYGNGARNLRVTERRRGRPPARADWHFEGARWRGVNRRDHRRHAMRFR